MLAHVSAPARPRARLAALGGVALARREARSRPGGRADVRKHAAP